eukprot:673705_1
MAQPKPKAFQIFVKTLDGKTITLDVNNATSTIADIKTKIHNCEGIKPEHQMLTYCGKKLNSNHTAKHYKLNAFDTIDLSLKLLSSPTTIAIKIPRNDDTSEIHIPFTPFTTLNDIKHHLSARHNQQTPPRYFVLDGRILRDPTIRIAQIDQIWNDLTLHTTFGVPFEEAVNASLGVMHRDQHLLSADEIDITHIMSTTPINTLVYEFLRRTTIDPLFYSGYCPFKQIVVSYNRTQLKLRMQWPLEYAQKLVPTSLMLGDKTPLEYANATESFGLLPETTLDMLAPLLSTCDCCTPESEICAGATHKHVVSSKTLPHNHNTEHDNVVRIQVELPDDPFILHKKFYYIDGIFYLRRTTKPKRKIDLQLFAVMRSPQTLNEELLICGYIRHETQHIPNDVVQVIVMLYPAVYGARYDIGKHNLDLCNQLYQKTDVFMIDNIAFYLKYGRQSEGDEEADEYVPSDDDTYYLVLDFAKQQTISEMVLLCRVYCKISDQSYTFVWNVSAPDVDAGDEAIYYIALPDFGIASSLSSMICDVQIVNMLRFCEKVARVYEYPALLTQRAYLLEWKVGPDLLGRFKKCVTEDYNQSFESPLFYDLFRLRCYPNENKRLLLSIQLISLPVNRPDKENTTGLTMRCQVYETNTRSHTREFETAFDYTEENSCCTTMLMSSDAIMKEEEDAQLQELHFTVKIVIVDPHNHIASPLLGYLRSRDPKQDIKGGRRKRRGLPR